MQVGLVPNPHAQQQSQHVASLKKKVTIIACLAAAFGILSAAITYWAETRVIHEILDNMINSGLFTDETTGEVPSLEGVGIFGPTMLLAIIPGIVIMCIVPACGFFGARNEHKDLVCLFSGCSGLQSCCGCCSVCMGILVIVGMGAVIPLLSTVFTDCDPSVKCPLLEDRPVVNGLVADLHAIDCLAASLWQSPGEYPNYDVYQTRYPLSEERMSTTCPTAQFLNCGWSSSSFGEPMSAASSAHQRARAASMQRLHENIRSPTTYHVRRLLAPLPRIRSSLGLAPSSARASVGFVSVNASRDDLYDPYDPYAPSQILPPMPADVLTACKADKTQIDAFHEVGAIFDGLWDSVRGLLWLSQALALFSAIISGIGAYYGKQLYNAFLHQSGYMTQQVYVQPGQIYAQPVQGVVVTGTGQQPGQAGSLQVMQPAYAQPMPAADPGAVEMRPAAPVELV